MRLVIELMPEHGHLNYQEYNGFFKEVTLWYDYKKTVFPTIKLAIAYILRYIPDDINKIKVHSSLCKEYNKGIKSVK